ncbi:MAG: hypothetical protein LBQ66_13730 [Planctomycetaceae bacterium]|nr:hypothetical protein [Planctomycetaceae bacterium]
MVIVRWATDCQAVASAYSPTVGAEHASAKLKPPKRRAFWLTTTIWRSAVFGLASLAENATARRSVAHLTITNAKKTCVV